MVRVVLIDADSGEILGEGDVPAEQLPESFAPATTTHLAEREWHVVRATPTTRAEYVASGALRLELREVRTVDPREVLMTIPTLENALPPLGAPDPAAIRMHEDDWRQRELVAARFEPQIRSELAEIRRIRAEHAIEVAGPPGFTAFRKLHVRAVLPEPLAGVSIPVAALAPLGDPHPLALGSTSGPAGVVVGGFAYPVGDGVVYGRSAGDRVVALGVGLGADPSLLAPIAAAHRLWFVDWCGTRTVSWDGDEVC